MQILVMSCWACVTCAHMYDAHALCKTSASKYLSGLACMQADPNLAKITTSRYRVGVLNTIPKMQIGTYQT